MRLPKPSKRRQNLTLSALGVVFGDIGTSPLYAVSAILTTIGLREFSPNEVIGCISLIIWALLITVTFKYVIFVMRADNDGQGGVFALYSLLHLHNKKRFAYRLALLILSAGLLFGDGVITPAISVLSAVEGLSVVTPQLAHFVVPGTVALLALLFAVQFAGTSRIGLLFGPITLAWFCTISLIGFKHILAAPEILIAFNPYYALSFLFENSLSTTLFVLGGVMLVVTGGEALYADMGHFGKKPIRRAWFIVVLPALLINYLGQGAFLLSGGKIVGGNVFFSTIPMPFLLPVVVLATMATVVASQALISGVFSLAAQATALGLFPRLRLIHTHDEHEGQIYAPFVNWVLFIGSVTLVLQFRSSLALASAYGLAVSGDMLTTSIAMISVAQIYWSWKKWHSYAIFGSLACVDLAFLLSNSTKFFDGGYIPLSIAIVVFVIMVSWRWGRKATYGAYTQVQSMTIADVISLKRKVSFFLEKNVILMVPKPVLSSQENAPALFQLFWERYRSLPRNLIFLEVVHRKVPFVHDERYKVTVFDKSPEHGSISSVTVYFGFMEEPNVEAILEDLARHHRIDLTPHPNEWMIHTTIENLLVPKKIPLLARWRLKLFLLLRQVSVPGYYFYGLGDRVQLSIEVLPVRLTV